jgi:hypothetical protein
MWGDDHEFCVGKGPKLACFRTLSQYSPGAPEENHKKFSVGYPVTWPQFELKTYESTSPPPHPAQFVLNHRKVESTVWSAVTRSTCTSLDLTAEHMSECKRHETTWQECTCLVVWRGAAVLETLAGRHGNGLLNGFPRDHGVTHQVSPETTQPVSQATTADGATTFIGFVQTSVRPAQLEVKNTALYFGGGSPVIISLPVGQRYHYHHQCRRRGEVVNARAFHSRRLFYWQIYRVFFQPHPQNTGVRT